jgi:hypothetical protein
MRSLDVSVNVKLWGERLDSSLFTWLNHASILGIGSMDILNIVRTDPRTHIVNPRFEATGWCYGDSLDLRPRPDALGVMFWDKVERQEVWCHVTKTIVILFCTRLKFANCDLLLKEFK